MRTTRSTIAEPSEFNAACAVLGLSTAPSSSEARTAFRDRAALLHPDVHQSAGAHRMSSATVAMQQLNDAYQLVLESLVARDEDRVDALGSGLARRCTRCRNEFQHTADAGQVACPRCGHGYRVRSRTPRSYSPDGPRAGRVFVSASTRPRRARQRTAPLGRLAHLGVWHAGS